MALPWRPVFCLFSSSKVRIGRDAPRLALALEQRCDLIKNESTEKMNLIHP